MYVYVLLKGQQNQQVRLIIFHCFNFSGVLYFTRVFSSLQNTSNKIITALRAMHLLLAFCSDKEEIFVYFILFLFLVFTMTTRRLRSSALDAVTAAANSTALDAAASRRQTRQRSSAAATPSTSSSKIGGGRGGSHVGNSATNRNARRNTALDSSSSDSDYSAAKINASARKRKNSENGGGQGQGGGRGRGRNSATNRNARRTTASATNGVANSSSSDSDYSGNQTLQSLVSDARKRKRINAAPKCTAASAKCNANRNANHNSNCNSNNRKTNNRNAVENRNAAATRTQRRSRQRNRKLNPQLPVDLNAPAQVFSYHSVMFSFMEFSYNRTFANDRAFHAQDADVEAITPQMVYRYFAKKAYGKPDPKAEDNPTCCRASSLQYYKKAISYWMGQSCDWNERTKTGNPTKSKLVNNIIAAVKKKETRGIGTKSKATRCFTDKEFERVIELMECAPCSLIDKLRYQAWIKFQAHLIARNDCTSKVFKSKLKRSIQHPDFLTVQMSWSKNVSEERDCPNQILLGSMNRKWCVLLSLSFFLEKWIRDGDGRTSQWLFSDGTVDATAQANVQEAESARQKSKFGAMIHSIVASEEFVMEQGGVLGTHSIRKFATTKAKSCGVGSHNVDYRARWKKTNKGQSDTYTDTQLLWPDVLVASKLCDGGVCIYKTKDGSGVTDEWLAREVCPACTGMFGAAVGAILAKSLLWACYDPAMMDLVPPDIRQDVCRKFIQVDSTLDNGENPIERVEVVVSQHNGTVCFDEISNEDREDGVAIAGGGGRIGGSSRVNEVWRNAMYAKLSNTQTVVKESHNFSVLKLAEVEKRLKRLESNIRILTTAPARRVGVAGAISVGHNVAIGAASEPTRPPILCDCPRTLNVLWDEYQNGIGGSKPARAFTRAERGRCRFKYSKRLLVWKCIDRLLDRGYSLGEACRKIHQVYGVVSITKIIKAMRRDENRGGHAALR